MSKHTRKSDQKNVVYSIELPKVQGEGYDEFKYYIPRLTQLDVVSAQKVKAKFAEDSDRELTYGSYLIGTLIEKVKPVSTEPPFDNLLSELSDESVDSVLEEILHLATTDAVTLAAETQTAS